MAVPYHEPQEYQQGSKQATLDVLSKDELEKIARPP